MPRGPSAGSGRCPPRDAEGRDARRRDGVRRGRPGCSQSVSRSSFAVLLVE
ncbi:hypothetical protein ACFFX0_30840 [Citricoccus parietis]|uniref:Uncharacterized protein n=1 Tax=Citricoccus parietis TaxID=592307 RepID=A0ABV5G8R5_9MICC